MDYVGRQMAMDLSYTMQMQKIVKYSPLKINFRCPICGDSEKDKYKARAWFYEQGADLRFGCFNCGKNYPFSYYLKIRHEDLYRKYLLEKHGERNKQQDKPKEEDLSKFNKVLKVVEKTELEKLACRVDLLPDGHPAKAYMVDRKIPDDKLSLFWFTMEWKKLSNVVCAGTYPNDTEKEPRIVIPIMDESGQICAMQGRALRKTDKIRYITVKASEDAQKIFGMERADGTKNVFFLEGPIDSVFINNALAIVGGEMALPDAPHKGKRVWVLDNEPRSRDTCNRMLKLIKAGERVVIWDRCEWSSKDVNDMVLKENASIVDINEYLNDNIVHGLAAELRFKNWIKVKL